jgi:hypothetical protein
VINPSLDFLWRKLSAAMEATAQVTTLDRGTVVDGSSMGVSDSLREAINRI